MRNIYGYIHTGRPGQKLSLYQNFVNLVFIKKEISLFIIHSSVHRQYIRRIQSKRCNVSQFIYFCKTLYVFHKVLPSIMSSQMHVQRQV